MPPGPADYTCDRRMNASPSIRTNGKPQSKRGGKRPTDEPNQKCFGRVWQRGLSRSYVLTAFPSSATPSHTSTSCSGGGIGYGGGIHGSYAQ